MRKPTLWRYYGLSLLLVLAVICWSLLGTLSRGLKQERLFIWSGRIGLPLVGLLCLLRGIDFLVLCKRYPPFLRESAPKWETHARRITPAVLVFQGVMAVLGGIVMMYFGGRGLILALLDGLP